MAVEDNRELHVLAVDDSLVDRKVIERLLKISSCKVTAVESGTRALQYLGLDGDKDSVCLDDLKVNMIITDYSMPGMTGYELLKKIKQGSSKLREIPVVVMSSENVLSNIDRCLEGGAEEFLVKPVKLADVQRLRDFVLSGEKCAEKTAPSRKRKTCEDLSFRVPKLGSPQLPTDRDTSLSPNPVPAAHQPTLGSPQSPLDRDISLSPSPVPAQHQPIQKRQRIIQAD